MTQAEYQRKWRAEHPDYAKDYYKKNKIQMKRNMARYYTGKNIGLSVKQKRALKKIYDALGAFLDSLD